MSDLQKSPLVLTKQQVETLYALARSGELALLGVQWVQFRPRDETEWKVVTSPRQEVAAEAVRVLLQEVRTPQGIGRRPDGGESRRPPAPAAARDVAGITRRRGRGPRRNERGVDESGIESAVVRIYRCSKVVKGGRTFSFGALVIAGDRKGNVGIGYGKANEVPPAVEKATKDARKSLFKVNLKGTTVPHTVKGRSGASTVVLVPARPGTGVTAGKSVRPCLELAGITDVLTKAYGSTSPKNLVKATMDALQQLQNRSQIEAARGIRLRASASELMYA